MLKSIPVALVVLYTYMSCNESSDHCGRSLTETVFYEAPVLHDTDTDDAVVSSVEENGRITALIHFNLEQEHRIESGYYSSHDGGESWYWAGRRILDVDDLLAQQVFTWETHPSDSHLRYRHFNMEDISAPIKRMVIQRSTDGGMKWQNVQARIRDSELRLDFIAEHYYHPRKVSTLYVAGQVEAIGPSSFGLYLSEDKGETFKMVLHRERDGSLLNLCFDRQNPDIIYAVASRGIVVKSVDGGKVWRPVPQSDTIAKPYVTEAIAGGTARRVGDRWNIVKEIQVDPAQGNTVYVVTEKGIVKSGDGGKTWLVLPLLAGKADAINNLRINPRDRNCLYAGTGLGLYKSLDQGCTWERVDVKNRIKRKQ